MCNIWGHLDCAVCVCVCVCVCARVRALCTEFLAFLPFWVLLLELIRGCLDRCHLEQETLVLSEAHTLFNLF